MKWTDNCFFHTYCLSTHNSCNESSSMSELGQSKTIIHQQRAFNSWNIVVALMLPPYYLQTQYDTYTMYEEIASQNHLHCASRAHLFEDKPRRQRIATKTNGETFSDKHREAALLVDRSQSQIVIMIGSRGTLKYRWTPQMQLLSLG